MQMRRDAVHIGAHDRVLAVARIDGAEPLDGCVILLNRGSLHLDRGDVARARADLQACAERATAIGDEAMAFKARHNLGYAEFVAGDLPRALQTMARAAERPGGVTSGIPLLDRAQVLLEAGLVTEAEAQSMLQRDVLGFIFMPGFTTKSGADHLSGRGVGMDVVKTNISKLGGVIDVHSELGIGTKMTVTLPITLAIISALVVVIAGRRYALPLASVLEALVFDPSGVRTIEGREVMTLRGATLALCRLEQLFGLPLPPDCPPPLRRFVVVVGVGTQRLGCVVDSLIGQQDIVIKPLGDSLEQVRGFAGATELGDQHVGLVIDAPAIVEEVLAGAAGEKATRLGARKAQGGEA